MNIHKTDIADVLLVEPKIISDARGFFYEGYNRLEWTYKTAFELNFVQENYSHSKRGTIRGLHYQIEHPQGKLITVFNGAIWDVAVDLRKGSTTFGKYVGIELTSTSKQQLWIPEGFAHGFMVLSEFADVMYKVTDYWYAQHERIITWNDQDLAINWPTWNLFRKPIVSDKDKCGLSFKEAVQEMEGT